MVQQRGKEMTNEEKAIEITVDITYHRQNQPVYFAAIKEAALEMAEWKDQQFKEYLEKKLNEAEQRKKYSIGLFPNNVISLNGAIGIINEIINELFGQTEQDNSDMEE